MIAIMLETRDLREASRQGESWTRNDDDLRQWTNDVVLARLPIVDTDSCIVANYII